MHWKHLVCLKHFNMPGEGSSYQKDGVRYESIPTNASGSGSGSSTKKWIVGAVVAVILAAVGKSTFYKTPGAATDAAVAKANLPTSKTGKLKLFDEHRKFPTWYRHFLAANAPIFSLFVCSCLNYLQYCRSLPHGRL